MKIKCKLVQRMQLMQSITVWVNVVSSCVVITAIAISILSHCFYKITNCDNSAAEMTVQSISLVCLIHIKTIWYRVSSSTIWLWPSGECASIPLSFHMCITQITHHNVVSLQSLRHSFVMVTIGKFNCEQICSVEIELFYNCTYRMHFFSCWWHSLFSFICFAINDNPCGRW